MKRLRYFKKTRKCWWRCKCGWCYNHHAVKMQKTKADYSLLEYQNNY